MAPMITGYGCQKGTVFLRQINSLDFADLTGSNPIRDTAPQHECHGAGCVSRPPRPAAR